MLVTLCAGLSRFPGAQCGMFKNITSDTNVVIHLKIFLGHSLCFSYLLILYFNVTDE